MSNRTGKREREARNRSKGRRCWVYGLSRNGAPVRALKLGRKKQMAFTVSRFAAVPRLAGVASSRPPKWWEGLAISYSRELPSACMTAVPVAEAERRMVGPKEPDRLAVNPSTPGNDEVPQ